MVSVGISVCIFGFGFGYQMREGNAKVELSI